MKGKGIEGNVPWIKDHSGLFVEISRQGTGQIVGDTEEPEGIVQSKDRCNSAQPDEGDVFFPRRRSFFYLWRFRRWWRERLFHFFNDRGAGNDVWDGYFSETIRHIS